MLSSVSLIFSIIVLQGMESLKFDTHFFKNIVGIFDMQMREFEPAF